MLIGGKEIVYSKRFFKLAHLKYEWNEELEDPKKFIEILKKGGLKADIFTFAQRLPDSKPKYNYFFEWDSVAAIPIKSYEYWIQNQVVKNSRKKMNLAQKKGIKIKLINFDDDLVNAILKIYHETPVVRGVPNSRYTLDFETTKKLNSTFLDRATFIGAFYRDELIAYIKLVSAGKFMRTMGILSLLSHRDKAPMNLLIAKSIEICIQKSLPYLTFAKYNYGKRGSKKLKAFKKNLGFESIIVPRYYIPLTLKGYIALKLRLHHEPVEYLPKFLINILIKARNSYYERKYRSHLDLLKNKL